MGKLWYLWAFLNQMRVHWTMRDSKSTWTLIVNSGYCSPLDIFVSCCFWYGHWRYQTKVLSVLNQSVTSLCKKKKCLNCQDIQTHCLVGDCNCIYAGTWEEEGEEWSIFVTCEVPEDAYSPYLLGCSCLHPETVLSEGSLLTLCGF